jgi:hypothetical protein
MSVLALHQSLLVGGGTTTDPNYANVSLLLHMDGSDGSTTFTDNSPSPRTMTANGNAQIDTTQFKFGGASGLFDGAGDYLSTPSNAVFNMGSGSFTIEGWIRFSSAGTRGVIAAQINSAGANSSISFWVERTAADKVRGFCVAGSSVFGDIVGSTTMSTDTWHHFAYVRDGNDFDIYLDGISDATTVVGASAVNSSANALGVGRAGEFDGIYLNGWLDDLRITKGVARYTANFTPPSTAFPNS